VAPDGAGARDAIVDARVPQVSGRHWPSQDRVLFNALPAFESLDVEDFCRRPMHGGTSASRGSLASPRRARARPALVRDSVLWRLPVYRARLRLLM